MYVEHIQAITGVTAFVFKNLYKKLFVNSAGISNAISHNWLFHCSPSGTINQKTHPWEKYMLFKNATKDEQ